MPQFLRPISVQANAWTIVPSGTASAVMAEVTPDDDTSYVHCTTNVALNVLVTLGVAPGDDDNHYFRVRAKKLAGSGASKITFVVSEKQGLLFAIVFSGEIIPTTSWVTYEFLIPVSGNGSNGNGAGTITNYGALYISLSSVIIAGDDLAVTWTELQVPDPVDLRVSSFGAAILGDAPAPYLRVSSFGASVLGKSVTLPQLCVSSLGVSVLGKIAGPNLRVTSFAASVLGRVQTALPQLRVSKLGVSILGKNSAVDRIVPLPILSPLPNHIMLNWDDDVILEDSYLTDISAAESVSEDRRSLIGKPFRTITARITGLIRSEANKIWMNLQRQSLHRSIFPLYCDQMKVTAASSGNTITCDPLYRRISFGERLVIHSWANGRPANPSYHTVVSFGGPIVVTPNLPMTYPIGSRVIPIMDVEVNLQGSGVFPSDDTYDVRAKFNEIPGPSALNPTVVTLPLWVQSFGGYPIFDLKPDWSTGIQSGVVRAGEQFGLGKANITLVRGDRAQKTHSLKMTCLNRALAWKVIEFFDYIKGRGRAFYVIAPEAVFAPTAVTATSITVAASGNFSDLQELIQYIAITKRDGTILIRTINSVADNVTTWDILFDTVGAITLAEVRKVTVAYLGRSNTDTLTERWQTDGTCNFDVEFVELLQEKEVVLTLPTLEVPPDNFPTTIPDIYWWGDGGYNVFKWTGGSGPQTRDFPAVQDDRMGLWDDIEGYGVRTDVHVEQDSSINNWSPTWESFTNPAVNNGRATLQHIQDGVMSEVYLKANDRQYWSNTLGLTIIICARFSAINTIFPHGQGYHPHKHTGTLEWLGTWNQSLDHKLKVFQTLDVVDTNLWIQGLPDFRTNSMSIIVLTWKPGLYTRIYRNGTLLGQAATPAASLPTTGLTRNIQIFSGMGWPSSTVPADPGGPGTEAISQLLNTVGYYRRALSIAEINSLGNYLKSRYAGFWTNIP
jgi:hypothetical protein